MENTILLHGKDYESDKALIESSISHDTIFLLDEPKTKLYEYIDYLHEELGMKSRIINKLRICRQIFFNGNITLLSGKGEKLSSPHSMKDLLNQLKPGTYYRLIIENNDRPLLANIVQQLIYIDYPLTEIDVKLRSENKDADKTERFMHHIRALRAAAQDAVDKISELCVDSAEVSDETREKLRYTRDLALSSYEKICEQINKAMDVEIKVAVAASKKTGKSVIVNCMLGTELAPTSQELATPNNCIYERSPDEQFHLYTLDEDGQPSQREDFNDAVKLRKRIYDTFKKAQQDYKNGFSCSDMCVSYVSNGNNFEAFTIYDTPGPDLAGASHDEHAEKAINICDVAIFAIDYTKYLTTTEEEFLRQIKAVFQEKHKFHTLIFLINKIDQALNDKGTKSRIKSIDFIRNRLKDIDENYGDCIVFATSAQDYFWSLELEKAAEQMEELSCLRGETTDLYQNLRPCKDSLEADNYEDEELINLLSNLDGEIGRIRSQLGYSTVDMKVLRYYSGIPQLMDYVSYVARSKAREEIVNSITYTIDVQCSALKVIIDEVANIDELMGKTQQEIDQISTILDEYVEEVRKILNPDLTEQDIGCLDPQKPMSALIDKHQGSWGFPLPISEVLQDARQAVSHLRESTMEEKIWNIFFEEYQEKVKRYLGQVIPKSTLNPTKGEAENAIQTYQEEEVEGRIKDEEQFVKDLALDLQSVVAGRMDQLTKSSEYCQHLLNKNDCHLQLPTPPVFDVAIPDPKFTDRFNVNGRLDVSELIPDIYAKPNIFEKLSSWIRHVRNLEFSYEEEGKVKNIPSEKDAVKLKASFTQMLRDIDVYPGIIRVLNEVAQNCKQAEDEILSHFSEMNDSYEKNVNVFRQGIDDRSYYMDKLSDYEKMKEFIADIQKASDDFLNAWESVVSE